MSTAATDEPEGFYSELERNWLVYPISERKDHGAWYEVGSAGVDGIVFAIRKDQEGVFAFYPIDREGDVAARRPLGAKDYPHSFKRDAPARPINQGGAHHGFGRAPRAPR